MKTKKNLILALVTGIWPLSALALVPEVDYMAGYLSIDNVERSSEATRIDITLKNRPHYWVMVDSAVVLTDESTGRTFRLIGQDNLPPSTKIWMPESGHHQGTLIFESIPEDVKVVDMLAPVDPDAEVYACDIHLDVPRREIKPAGISKEDVIARASHPDAWEGLSPAKYRDMNFVCPGVKALLRGHIDHYTPKAAYSTVSVITENEISNKDYKSVGDIDSLGNFSVAVPVDYPQMAYMVCGDMFSEIFLTPGDTLDVHTTTRTDRCAPYWRDAPEYFNLSGSNQDAVDISLLVRDIDSKLISTEYNWRRISQLAESGLDSIMAANKEIKSHMSQFVKTAPVEIDRYPVSAYAKDILYTHALVNNYLPLEDLAMRWRDKSMLMEGTEADRRWVPNPDYKEIDVLAYYGGQDDYAALVYDNPLVLIETGPFVNRCEYNPLFRPIGESSMILPVDTEEDGSRYGRIMSYDKNTLGEIGLSGCFMEQIVAAHGLCWTISHYQDTTPEGLRALSMSVGEILPVIDNKALVSSVLDEWGAVCREAGRKEAGASAVESRSVDSRSAVLAEVTRPYLGNVIYVDVWSYGCGPCRAGMLDQRELITHYNGQPLTIIYLAEENEKEQCERWMRENNIKGEHVFIPHDKMERFKGDFNIVGIPFGILIDKKGNVCHTNLHSIYINDANIEALLKE